MYIWIGCKLPEDFEQQLRRHCLQLNEAIGLDTTAFSLPQHISLKISFQTEAAPEVLAHLAAFLAEQKPFPVCVAPAEQAGNILWLPVEENTQLQWLHRQLDQRLEQYFQIPQHTFDKAFLFHSTLFMDENHQKLAEMKQLLSSFPLHRELQVDTFLLGVSDSGKPGTYRVVREIQVVC
jgi:2'-5' RNA ligase